MISQNVRDYLKKRGITQTAVAEAVGMSPQSMNCILSGETTLKAEDYVAICDFLEVPYSQFVDKRK